MPEPTPASLRIAVLLDCDNVSPKYAGLILEELATYGTPTIKRAYGDWTTTNLNGWKKALNELAIQPVQQFAYTIGKNSSDSALIIDAMDLLWMGNVDAFALVSSDSDFTRLATRLREGGKRVIGLGARKTPASLRNAVDQFIYLELLGTATDHDVDDDETGEDAPAKEENAKASEGSGRSGSRRGGRGRGRGSKTTDAADTPEATDADAADVADAEAPGADKAPAGDAAGKDGKGPQAKSGAGRRGRRASSSDVTEDPTPPEVPVEAEPEHDEAEPEHDEADAAPRIDLQAALTKAVNATSTDDGWATLSLIGQHLSRTHVDFDPRDFGHSKLSTLVEDQPYLRTRTEGRTMEVSLVRRRSRRAEG
ncbi:NYN domain-containing protein [Micrococcus luteus]|uniref:NYN domain-containing protein n=1 Tax=Micrococcus luteus TaxID=1270 RepID=A0AAP3AIY0_MICLU|nr:NYN domain-containing protein [Micrococcus luteus]MCV7588263.1 NYN domain-containing protein [Micrococcus luteus]MCV7594165.1 NYN domain-containing protein [Micrococcus luteus]MCV7629941.1 NYN domain-containing protein [Micrococcus luteus]